MTCYCITILRWLFWVKRNAAHKRPPEVTAQPPTASAGKHAHTYTDVSVGEESPGEPCQCAAKQQQQHSAHTEEVMLLLFSALPSFPRNSRLTSFPEHSPSDLCHCLPIVFSQRNICRPHRAPLPLTHFAKNVHSVAGNQSSLSPSPLPPILLPSLHSFNMWFQKNESGQSRWFLLVSLLVQQSQCWYSASSIFGTTTTNRCKKISNTIKDHDFRIWDSLKNTVSSPNNWLSFTHSILFVFRYKTKQLDR